MTNLTKFEDLLGKTLADVVQNKDKEIVFTLDTGEKYKLYHLQDCCEKVTVEDVCGDLKDLVGSPIIAASEDTNSQENPKGVTPPDYQESFTWTFYNIGTTKGHVTIRWYGESNGYYSESVDFGEAL